MSSLNISPEACLYRTGWGQAEKLPYPLSTTLFPSWSMDISLKDDETIILLQCVSSMPKTYDGLLEVICPTVCLFFFFFSSRSIHIISDTSLVKCKPTVLIAMVAVQKSTYNSWTMNLNQVCGIGYNKVDFFVENEEHRPFDGCKIEI